MRKLVQVIVAAPVLGSAIAAAAEPSPDPTDFIAHLTAFAEMCATLSPEIADTPALLVESMSPQDRRQCEATSRSAAFGPLLAQARAEFAKAPREGRLQACKAMHEGLEKR